MAPQIRPLVLLVMAQRAGIAVPVTLPLLMPSERLPLPPLMTVLIIMTVIAVVVMILRLGDRPAGNAGESDESNGESDAG